MFNISKPSANRVDIDLSGALDANMMAEGLDDLIAKSQDVSQGRMLYTITDFEMPTLGSLGVEFTRLPKLFGLLARFDKCAVLSDTGWLRKAAEIEGVLIPGLDIKAFDLDDRAAAEAWLEAP